MPRQAFIVTGLGYGDEGKGTVTHWLSHRHKAHTVIRTGGPQALHHVVCAGGTSHVFSQFGSGALRGSATHLSKHMLIDPHAILKEGEVLLYEHGLRGVFESMTIHEDALVISPFQAIAGRVRELVRGSARLGSVGIGVGETMLDAERLGEQAIRAKDFARESLLREKLTALQRLKWAEFEAYYDRASGLPPDIRDSVRIELAEMENADTVQWAVERFTELHRRVRIVDTEYVAAELLGGAGTVVFEGSQGVLLDRWKGFHPYITKVCTTPEPARGILRECGYDGPITSLGVLRAYHTRHGGGPFVSESHTLTEALPDAMNKTHRWQGSFRVGHFDALMARYALDACGESIDAVVLTCLDRAAALQSFTYCPAYQYNGSSVTRLLYLAGTSDGERIALQTKLSHYLARCEPVVRGASLSGTMSECAEACLSILKSFIPAPVYAVSYGPTEADKQETEKGH